MLPFKINQRVIDQFIETGEVDELYLRVICFKIIKNKVRLTINLTTFVQLHSKYFLPVNPCRYWFHE